MISNIQKDASERMEKSIASLGQELTKVRTGRASTGILDQVKVSYYGQDVPLSQVASVVVEDARTLNVSPWEKQLIGDIEKAIMAANLGLNPATNGNVIRVPMPPLTEERRRDLVKVVKAEGENTRIAIRNIRRDANNSIRQLLKDKEVTEDEVKKAEDQIQKLTDQEIGKVDEILKQKEADLMQV
jgi:ribosome recycling factor